MPKQDRAIRTRRVIVEAAAGVFEERGFQAATIAEILARGQVTKGALYFHFASKEALARGLLEEQLPDGLPLLPRSIKLQEVIDLIASQTYRLRTDPVVRAAVRLSLDEGAMGGRRGDAFTGWSGQLARSMEEAAGRGELLPHVVPGESADVLVGAFAGIQSMSQALSNYADLAERMEALTRHLMPAIALPSVLASLDFDLDRIARAALEQEPADDGEEVAAG
ncbi:TetR family transcriptional regulator [Streptomyces sp. SID5785]|uniref:ScbR family autoregulator-binding transcription factor n=1 Tax=Streptomyces sp. SID5785 TaxID=2690309 RepID=UPI0013610AE5|nr:TetR family transcriptional regulator [Streptomyces sp. SID5785]MZD09668.1 TetR family transcriptional regulator [Streptomyces sp. SID5785]